MVEHASACCVLMVAIPIMGTLSDRFGRKPLLLACCVAFIVLPYPLFSYPARAARRSCTMILIQIAVRAR